MLVRVAIEQYNCLLYHLAVKGFTHGRDFEVIPSQNLDSFFINFINQAGYDTYLAWKGA